ncbi:MAG: PhnD/SsuA/transferrin family substrate-binding protein [Anaerolineales bacterium]|nr:PhnD/SsuA/transferrin family substrate-binding protein [Anaerolineales bacterium]
MKRLLFFLFLGLFACTLPVVGISTPAPTSTPPIVSTPTATPQPTLPPGSVKNPLLLALAPSAPPADDVIAAANELAAKLEALTGYHFVTVAPPSEAGLVKLLGAGNVNIAALSPLAYLTAYNNNGARAALASTKKGKAFYGAQFIARTSDNYDVFFDPIRAENTASAAEALNQFKDKKPCWSDAASPSGYVIPLGVLNQAKVQTRPGAFVEGQPTVVRAVYAGGICDFGATYIDARENPALESDYPDVKDRVDIIWRIPAIIPYNLIVFSANVTPDVERSLLRAFVDIMTTADGKALVQKIYGMDELQIVQDAVYEDFRSYVKDSGVNLNELMK